MLVVILVTAKRHCACLALAAALLGALLAPLLGVMLSPVLAQQGAGQSNKPINLRVASWNLDRSIPARLSRRFERRTNLWRTTFGPRAAKTRPKTIKQLNVEADVIALQAISDLRVVRRLFPARQFHIIVSRQLLLNAERRRRDSLSGAHSRNNNRATGPGLRAPHSGTTAIVIRRASGWRAGRRQHLLRFAGPALRDATLPHRTAAMAVRLKRRRKSFWLLSLDLAPPCKGLTTKAASQSNADQPKPRQPNSCADRRRQLKLLRDWVSLKRDMGEDVIVAGSFAGPLKIGQLAPASGQAGTSSPRKFKTFPRSLSAQGCSIGAGAGTAQPGNKTKTRQNAAQGHTPNNGSIRDMILVDVIKRAGYSLAAKSRIMANPNGVHCPVIVDLTL